jgi:hypothetical protein
LINSATKPLSSYACLECQKNSCLRCGTPPRHTPSSHWWSRTCSSSSPLSSFLLVFTAVTLHHPLLLTLYSPVANRSVCVEYGVSGPREDPADITDRSPISLPVLGVPASLVFGYAWPTSQFNVSNTPRFGAVYMSCAVGVYV